MEYQFSMNIRSGGGAVTSSNQDNIDQVFTQGLNKVSQGQIITGIVEEVINDVTLDFNGQKVTASKDIIGKASPGDVKNFEVVKASSDKIELRLLDNSLLPQKAILSIHMEASDFENIIAEKEQSQGKIEHETRFQDLLGKLKQISVSLTEQDLSLLEKEGFPLEGFTVEGLKEALGRIKTAGGGDLTYPMPNQAKTNEVTPTPASQNVMVYDKSVLTEKLKEENLPVTGENLLKLDVAMKLSDAVSKMDDRAISYLISRGVEPTIENIYKALYSKGSPIRTTGIKLSEAAWKELQGQVKGVITAAGYEINGQNLTDARWLIENQLPLTEETFSYKKNLDSIRVSADPKAILDKMLSGMKNGLDPKDVSLRQVSLAHLKNVIADVHTISDKAVAEAVQNNHKLTIKNLSMIQKQIIPSEAKAENNVEQYIIKTAVKLTESAERIVALSEKIVEAGSDMQSFIRENTSSKDVVETGTDQTFVKINNSAKELSAQAAAIVKAGEAISEQAKEAGEHETGSIRIPYLAADIIQRATKITQEAVAITHYIDEVADTAADPSKKDTELPDKAIDITKSAVDTTKEISDITKAAMKLIDVAQDIEKPVSNLVQTQEINPAVKESLTEEDSKSEQRDNGNTEEDSSDYQYEVLRAKRQLEEIRLKMTLEAAGRLESKGIKIDTEDLTRVVDALREQEDQYYSKLLSEADVPVSETDIQTLKQTTQGLEQLKYLPCAVLGTTLQGRSTQTITGLLGEGSRLQAEYAKAGTAYETLATVPNGEYGDSIKKAFAGADSLLRQIGLDNTEQNRRAVRILGYNQMEITKEAVGQVKTYDLQVTELMQNLHPAVTVRMIKEGINPLSMPINELNHTIDQIKEDQGITSEDKFSTYLRELEKQEGITPEERKAYIGVYRLLYNIDKSDGAALGAVIKSDREVTLGNLLTAVMTNSKGRLEAVINDEFGTLQGISQSRETMAQQLSTFSGMESSQGTAQNNEGQAALSPEKEQEAIVEQTEYMERIVKKLKENLTPQSLTKAGSSLALSADHLSFVSRANESAVPYKGIWESIRQVPVEKLLEQLRGTQQDQVQDNETAKVRVQQLQELSKNSEQSIRFLNDYRIPSTPLNILMAGNLLSNGDSPLKRLIKQKNEKPVEISENSIKELNNLSDKLDDKNSIQEVYANLETDAKEAMSRSCSEEIIDSRRLAELKSMSGQMTFIRTLADKEFYQIPIETEKGITNMNLTILRGSETSGTVSVGIQSEQLGDIKAEFSLKDRILKGYFGSDNRYGLEQLQKNTEIIETAAQESNITIKQLDYSIQKRDKGSYNYPNPGKEANHVTKDTERILYRIAKAVVMTVREAENSKEGIDRAVS